MSCFAPAKARLRTLTCPPSAVRCSTQLEKIPDAIILDPTLQREAGVVCPSCGSHGAVFVQPKEAPGDTRMKIVNICLNAECVHKWE